jgi:hypothetical protein
VIKESVTRGVTVSFIVWSFHFMFLSYFAHFILCFFHILLISFQLVLIYFTRMSKKMKSLLVKSFLKRSKDDNMEGLFQGSSSSSSMCQALMSAVQA